MSMRSSPWRDAVGDDLVQLAGEVQVHAVGQMAAVGQVHGQDGVARLQAGEIHGHVGLAPEWGWTLAYSAAEQLD